MLEILVLIFITRSLARRAAAKGLSKTWGGLAPALWITGEIIGLVIGFAIGLDTGAYLTALLGAAAGAVTAFIIVGRLSPQLPPTPVAADVGGVGSFDADNPYSPPGTYSPTAKG